MTIKIGADPEVFVRVNKLATSAFGMIPGTKDNPFPVEGGAVQVDGMALEYNINPALTCHEFVENNVMVLNTLKSMLPKGAKVHIEPVETFSQDFLDSQPIEATDLGCDPDYSAYNIRANVAPSKNSEFRTASGHIHIGWRDGVDINDPSHIEDCKLVVKELDLRLGLPSRLLESEGLSLQRRTMYGKAGSYRPKEYGVEYRVLSNFWVKDIRAMKWVYNTVQETMNDILNPKKALESSKAYHGDVMFYINSAKLADVRQYMRYRGIKCAAL